MLTNLLARVTAAILVFSACASAQSQAEGSFIHPRSPIVCKQVRVTPSDSADVILDFTDGPDSAGQRNALAAFDSTGRPLYMLVFVRQADSTEWPKAFAVRFHPTPSGTHISMSKLGEKVRAKLSPVDPARPQAADDEEMTTSEIAMRE